MDCFTKEYSLYKSTNEMLRLRNTAGVPGCSKHKPFQECISKHVWKMWFRRQVKTFFYCNLNHVLNLFAFLNPKLVETFDFTKTGVDYDYPFSVGTWHYLLCFISDLNNSSSTCKNCFDQEWKFSAYNRASSYQAKSKTLRTFTKLRVELM